MNQNLDEIQVVVLSRRGQIHAARGIAGALRDRGHKVVTWDEIVECSANPDEARKAIDRVVDNAPYVALVGTGGRGTWCLAGRAAVRGAKIVYVGRGPDLGDTERAVVFWRVSGAMQCIGLLGYVLENPTEDANRCGYIAEGG